MGLTLNSNSLTLEAAGGAAGGGAAAASLSEADVNTLIKAKTDWTFIESLDASGANSAEFTIDNSYVMYKVIAEDVRSSAHYTKFRIKVGGSEIGSGYGVSMWRGRSSSNGYYYQDGTDSWHSNHQDPHDHMSNYEYIITGLVSGRKPTARWHYGGGTSTQDGGFSIAGGMCNNTGEVTGFKLLNPYANWSSGNFKLYGLN